LGGRLGRGPKKTPRVAVEDEVLSPNVPPGSRFKGYQDYIVQDLVIRARVIRYRRARWVTTGGETVIAALPAGELNGYLDMSMSLKTQGDASKGSFRWETVAPVRTHCPRVSSNRDQEVSVFNTTYL
jgi:hypothetical protein